MLLPVTRPAWVACWLHTLLWSGQRAPCRFSEDVGAPTVQASPPHGGDVGTASCRRRLISRSLPQIAACPSSAPCPAHLCRCGLHPLPVQGPALLGAGQDDSSPVKFCVSLQYDVQSCRNFYMSLLHVLCGSAIGPMHAHFKDPIILLLARKSALLSITTWLRSVGSSALHVLARFPRQIRSYGIF